MNSRFKQLILKLTGTEMLVAAHERDVLASNNFINFFAKGSALSLAMYATAMAISPPTEQKIKSDAWFMLAFFTTLWHSLIAFFIVADHGKNRAPIESLSKATVTAATAAAAYTLASSDTHPLCNNRALFTGLFTAPVLTMAYSVQTADSTRRVLTDVVQHSFEAAVATEIADRLLSQRNTCKL